MAKALETDLIRLQCYEGLDASHAIYEWNYQYQLLHLKLVDKKDQKSLEQDIFSEKFLLKRPLLEAISREKSPVLLIDEIDRADEEFESFLPEINKLRSEDNWQSVFIRLEQADSSIEDTIELLKENYNKITQQVFSFQGYLFPANVLRIQQQRIESEKKRFREVLGQIVEEKKQAVPLEELETSQEPVFELKIMDDPDIPDAMTFQLELDGQPIVPPDDALSLMSSIIQDLGEIPEQYLVAAGPGKYDADNKPDNKKQDPWSGIYHEEGACFYDEWDYVRQHYRKNWCVVREIKVTRQHDDFVQDTLNRYTGIVKSLRRNFEALKGEEK